MVQLLVFHRREFEVLGAACNRQFTYVITAVLFRQREASCFRAIHGINAHGLCKEVKIAVFLR